MIFQFFKVNLLLLFIINLIAIPYIHSDRKYGIGNTNSYFFYKSNAFIERTCNCSMTMSCSCCESVVMLLMQTTKSLCVNFIYQRNGLNVDISLDSVILRTLSVKIYQPFTMCTSIPRSLYSFACLNVLQLNYSPQSIAACIRLEIKTKAQDWKLTYKCMNISTTLPMINNKTANIQLPDVAINAQIILTTSASPLFNVVSTSTSSPISVILNEQAIPSTSVTDTVSLVSARSNFTTPQ